MRKEFSINAILLIAINFIVKPLYIFYVETGVQNLVGPESYGTYFVIFDFVFLFVFINDAGLQNYNARTLATKDGFDSAYFSHIIGHKLLLSGLFVLITSLAAYWFGYLTSHPWLYLTIILTFVFNAIFVLLRSSLSSIGYYRWDTYLSVLDKLILLIILGFMVWKGYKGAGFDLIYYPMVQLLVAIVVCLIAITFVVKSGWYMHISLDWGKVKSVAREMWPYTMILLFSTAYNRTDAVMLDKMLSEGRHYAGLYAGAYRYLEAGSMVGFIFASLLLPMFTRMLTKDEEVKPLFEVAFKVLLLVGTLGMCIGMFFSRELYALLYSASYQDSHMLLREMMIALIPVVLSHCFGSYLIAAGRLKSINIIFVTGFVINVLCNFLLIPDLYHFGAVYATNITQLFLLGGLALVTHKANAQLQLPSLIVMGLLCSLLILGIFYAVTHFLPIAWYGMIGVATLLSLMAVVLVRWIDPMQIFKEQ